jgi:hypothetical protein
MGTARCGPACRVVWGERVQSPFLPDSPRLFYAVKSSTAKPLCRMIERSVPVFSSLWFETGTVIVVPGRDFCIMIWLPRCLT